MCRVFPWMRSGKRPSPSGASGWASPGLADALIFCKARYGSAQSIALIQNWLSQSQPCRLSRLGRRWPRKRAPFPLFDRDAYLARPHIQALPPDICQAIAAHGIRNALLTSIAPTGTISLFADNVSSGIEPVFALSYSRKVLQPDGSQQRRDGRGLCLAQIPRPVRRRRRPARLFRHRPDHRAVGSSGGAGRLPALYRLRRFPRPSMCRARFPSRLSRMSIPTAYEQGCKGCTTYRPNDVTGSVLAALDRNSRSRSTPCPRKPRSPRMSRNCRCQRRQPREARGGVVYMTKPLDRPEALLGRTYKIKWLESDHAFYITINDIEKDGRRRPFEVFINSKNMEAYAWALALTRMISAVFRRGGDVSFVVDELKAIFDPRGGQWMGGRYVPSLLAAIGEVIERHMIEIGFHGHARGRRLPALPRCRVKARRRISAPAAARPVLCMWKAAIPACPAAIPNAADRLIRVAAMKSAFRVNYSSRFWLFAPLACFWRLAAWAMAHWWVVAGARGQKARRHERP